MPLGQTTGDIFSGDTYNYNPTKYNQYASYSPYSSQLGDTSRANLLQMQSGQLSPSSQALLNQQFNQNLASTREGAYGMPLGAQKGLEMQQAGQNALSAAQLAEQQRQWAISQSLPWEQMGASQAQFGYTAGMNENRYAQDWAENQNQQADYYKLNSGKGGLFGALQGAAGNFLGQLGGGFGTQFANQLLGGGGSQNLLPSDQPFAQVDFGSDIDNLGSMPFGSSMNSNFKF